MAARIAPVEAQCWTVMWRRNLVLTVSVVALFCGRSAHAAQTVDVIDDASPGQTLTIVAPEGPTISAEAGASLPSMPYASTDQSAAQIPDLTPAAARKSFNPSFNNGKVAQHRDFTLDASADIKEIFTTNANAFSSNSAELSSLNATSPSLSLTSKRADLDSKLSASLSTTIDRARFNAQIDNTIADDLYLRSSQLNQVTDNLTALTTTKIVPNILTLDARAYSTPVNQTNLGVIDPTQRAISGSGNTGYSDSVGYTVSPSLTNRFGDFGSSTLKLSSGAAIFINHQNPDAASTLNGTNPASTRTKEASETFKSGSDFNRLQWILNGDITKTTGGTDLTNETGGVEFDYALNHYFMLILRGGDDQLSSPQAQLGGYSRPYGIGGIRYHPNPKLTFHLEVGSRYGRPNVTGDVHYVISPRTTFTATLTNNVTTPSLRLLDNLNNLQTSTPTSTVLPADQLPLTNSIDRVESLNMSITRQAARTQETLSVFATTETTLGQVNAFQNSNQDSVGTTLSISHTLTQHITANLVGTYSVERSGPGLRDKIMQANADLSYALGRKTSVDFGTSYFARIEDNPSSFTLLSNSYQGGSLRDVELTISLHRRF